jgi:hypothetical protein
MRTLADVDRSHQRISSSEWERPPRPPTGMKPLPPAPRARRRVGEQRSGDGVDLLPGSVYPPMRGERNQHPGTEDPGDESADHAEADLLRDDAQRLDLCSLLGRR